MIEIVESKYGDIVLTTCPHCGHYNEDDIQIIFAAYRDSASLRCADCKKDFWVELSCLTRAAELLRAPVQTHTMEAIIKDIMDYVNVSLVDEHEEDFERFLRERVFGG